MGMRLLCEIAFRKGWEGYLENNFDDAKSKLTSDEKTTLRSQSVKKGKIVDLLQSGAPWLYSFK